MPKLRRLPGHEVVANLKPFGFLVVAQRGSHMKLKRMGPDGAPPRRVFAHHLNRRWQHERQMTVSKTYVAEMCGKHQYLIR